MTVEPARKLEPLNPVWSGSRIGKEVGVLRGYIRWSNEIKISGRWRRGYI